MQLPTVWLGSLPNGTAVPRHISRHTDYTWTSTSLGSLLPGATLKEYAVDLARTDIVRVAAISTSQSGTDLLSKHVFSSGNWDTSLIATAPAGSTFESLSAGSITGGGYLIVLRQVEGNARTGSSRWMAHQEV